MPESASENFSKALHKLYRAFSKYPCNGIDHYYLISKEYAKHLLRADVHNLPVKDTADFLFHAFSSWGDEVDFKHFLPRILELSYSHPSEIEIWLVVDQILHDACDWKNWPITEQQAVREFFVAYWQRWVSTLPDRFTFNSQPTDRLLLSIDKLLGNIDDMLAYWDALKGIEADMQLAYLMGWNYCTSPDEYQKLTLSEQKLIKWLYKPSHQERLEAAFFNTSDPSFQEVFSSALNDHAWNADFHKHIRALDEGGDV